MKNKKFDCVDMKWEIQQKLAEEYRDVPDTEARQLQLKKVEQNRFLGPVLKQIKSKRNKVNG